MRATSELDEIQNFHAPEQSAGVVKVEPVFREAPQ